MNNAHICNETFFAMVKEQQVGQPCSSGKNRRRSGQRQSETKHESHKYEPGIYFKLQVFHWHVWTMKLSYRHLK